ncbi:RacO protein [Nonomuraea turkmeniaca]|uniref:RacO protein n=1 Tax=Nonomuraea turkmeniaca TaxID=103838 RepID=A0A5S4EZY8_9ACTN|nr:DUF6192 family protein [Nonomuraea turkmeniaca]TMR09245.1 RacO protein [Nonomuraea turkmeniaca]
MPTMIGHVTQERYDQIVTRGRELVELQTRSQFQLGDLALELEPIQPHGGAHPNQGEALFGVLESLQLFADDLAIPVKTLETHRWVASRWPAQHRQAGVPYYIHKTLASIRDDEERWARIANPPLDNRTGTRRWTDTAAKQAVDQKLVNTASVQQKVARIHDLARDEEVAVRVATDLLRRPQAAERSMRDDLAKHMVNRAQVEHALLAGQVVRKRTPALPRIERSRDFLDLIGACSLFVASVGRILPGSATIGSPAKSAPRWRVTWPASGRQPIGWRPPSSRGT